MFSLDWEICAECMALHCVVFCLIFFSSCYFHFNAFCIKAKARVNAFDLLGLTNNITLPSKCEQNWNSWYAAIKAYDLCGWSIFVFGIMSMPHKYADIDEQKKIHAAVFAVCIKYHFENSKQKPPLKNIKNRSFEKIDYLLHKFNSTTKTCYLSYHVWKAVCFFLQINAQRVTIEELFNIFE